MSRSSDFDEEQYPLSNQGDCDFELKDDDDYFYMETLISMLSG